MEDWATSLLSWSCVGRTQSDRGMYYVSGSERAYSVLRQQIYGLLCPVSCLLLLATKYGVHPVFPETIGGTANSLFAHPRVNPCHALQ